jgi:hypothetical protein
MLAAHPGSVCHGQAPRPKQKREDTTVPTTSLRPVRRLRLLAVVQTALILASLGVPIGGHKGYGLALVMEVLSGVLTGAGFCLDHRREQLRRNSEPPDLGHFFLAIDPHLFMPLAEFTARVDRLIEQAKSGARVKGVDEILIPGEAELRARERSLKEGVLIRASAYRTLRRYAEEAGLTADLAVVRPLIAGSRTGIARQL